LLVEHRAAIVIHHDEVPDLAMDVEIFLEEKGYAVVIFENKG
jgi:hypothetical protein